MQTVESMKTYNFYCLETICTYLKVSKKYLNIIVKKLSSRLVFKCCLNSFMSLDSAEHFIITSAMLIKIDYIKIS